MEKKTSVLKFFAVVGAFTACFFVIFELSETLGLNKFENTHSVTNTMEMKRAKGGGYNVKIKNITGAISTNKPNEQTYYDLDITLKTNSSEAAKLLTDNHAKTMNIICNTISNFSSEELTNHLERNILKTNIIRNLSRAYGTSEIDAVYLEKFVYQNKYMPVNIF